MPTGADFRREAARMTDFVEHWSELGRHCDRLVESTGIVGPVQRVIEILGSHAQVHARSTGAIAVDLIDELHRRAAVCDHFDAEMRTWRRAHDRWVHDVRHYRQATSAGISAHWPGPEPTPPPRPFREAEAS